MGDGMLWMFFFLCAGLMLLILARYLASTRQRSLDLMRQQDPQMASEVEQVAYSRNRAILPLRERAFEKPGHYQQY
jgi:hypothetical protein